MGGRAANVDGVRVEPGAAADPVHDLVRHRPVRHDAQPPAEPAEQAEVMGDGVAQAAIAAVADEGGHSGILGRGQRRRGRAQGHAPQHDRTLRPRTRKRGRGVHVLLLEEAEARDVAPALAVMAQVEQQRVPAQLVEERDLLDHLDARAVQSVNEDDRAVRIGRRHPPSLERHRVGGVEGDILVRQLELRGREARVLAVVVGEAADGGQARQPIGSPAEDEDRHQGQEDETDPLEPLHRRTASRVRRRRSPAAGEVAPPRRARGPGDDSRGRRETPDGQGTGRGRATDLIGRAGEASPGAWIRPRRAVTSSQWHVPSDAQRTLRRLRGHVLSNLVSGCDLKSRSLRTR